MEIAARIASRAPLAVSVVEAELSSLSKGIPPERRRVRVHSGCAASRIL
jgi:hypothetical protein